MDSLYNHLIGKKYKQLTIQKVTKVIPRKYLHKGRRNGKRYYVECNCTCGNVVEIRLDAILYGKQGSCGCQKGGVRVDEFSPFRIFLAHIRDRKKYNNYKHEVNIDLPYLKKIWKKQNGICPYTGIEMILYPTCDQRKIKNPVQASLDRIDSSKGYIKGNVEFVCLAINYAKNGFTKEEFMNFLLQITTIR